MKRPAVKTLIIAVSLVLTLSIGTSVFALNFEINDNQFPKDKDKWVEQKKNADQKKIEEQREKLGIPQNAAPSMNCMANLNKEDAEKVKAERDQFFKATQNLRQEIMSKELLLQSELVKPVTDVQKAMALQKELSDFEAELDQQQLLHLLEIKKISPDAAAACMNKGRGGMGGGCPMTRR